MDATQKKLLEDAARAAGDEFVNLLSHEKWNPLDDDAQALRLAVKLRMEIQWDEYEVVAINYDQPINSYEYHAASEFHLKDPATATRRAIVRVAAAIGKQA